MRQPPWGAWKGRGTWGWNGSEGGDTVRPDPKTDARYHNEWSRLCFTAMAGDKKKFTSCPCKMGVRLGVAMGSLEGLAG